jgi:hypothetical protein
MDGGFMKVKLWRQDHLADRSEGERLTVRNFKTFQQVVFKIPTLKACGKAEFQPGTSPGT